MCTRNADRLKLVVVNSFGAGVFTAQQLRDAWGSMYRGHPFTKQPIADYCVNMKAGHPPRPENHMPEKDMFLFRVKEGVYRMHDPQRDGLWRRVGDCMEQVD